VREPAKPPTEVAICIATCRRPDGLRRLLEGLTRLELGKGAPSLRVIVVDNDPGSRSGSTRSILQALAPKLPGKLTLLSEPTRGISYARNAALEALMPGEWAAFIDDDEVPEPLWLDALLEVQRATSADVVTGPVVPRFVEEPPAWAVDGDFFERQRYSTGTLLGVAYTHNVLLSDAAATDRFDHSFALTGGSDSHYFRRLHRAGYRIVWADEALVGEWIPSSRVSVRAIMRRSFRVGNGLCRIALEAEPGAKTVVIALVRALSRLLRGSAQLLAFSFGPARHRVRALDTIASGAGRVVALLGGSTTEYGRVHGS
jgi:glycosyltransferase involved in cell wall biosynthesis